MAKKLLTNYFKLHNIKQFRESITEPANNAYYVFAAKHTPYTGGDTAVPDITDSIQESFYNPYKHMVFGKRVTESDLRVMVKRNRWTENTVYTPYRSNTSLANASFFVCVEKSDGAHIFKCLDNAGGARSTAEPNRNDVTANTEYYSTSDGYIWKWMYSLDTSTFRKFSTDLYIPVVPDSDISGNAVAGAIEVVTISSGGSDYNTFLANTFLASDLRIGGNPRYYALAENASSEAEYYKDSFLYLINGTGRGQGRKITRFFISGSNKVAEIESEFTIAPDSTTQYEVTPFVSITGDGTGATARALVNTSSSNTIYKIEIITRGSSYTYASAQITGYQGGGSNTATVAPVLGPKGGHGSDPENELFGSVLGISVDFDKSESGAIPTNNNYRVVGLIKDPLFANVQVNFPSTVSTFDIGETVTQQNGATGKVVTFNAISPAYLRLTNVNGQFVSGQTVTGSITNANGVVSSVQVNGGNASFATFDQRAKLTVSSKAGSFAENESVYQVASSVANGYVHEYDSLNSFVYLTDVRGTINSGERIIGDTGSANVDTFTPPDIVEGSGEVLIIENQDPIDRSNSQIETIKFILQF